jgi:prepilin peptidase CpaA
MLATVLLLGLVLVASVTDLSRRKIYNWTTYSGMIAALGSSAAGSLWLARGGIGEGRLAWWGWIPLRQSLLGLAACGAVMLVCYVLFRIGGGDVKLIAMLGAFLGLEQGIEAMLWTFVLGACTALIVLVWRVGPVRLAGRLWRQIAAVFRLPYWSPLTEAERGELHSPLFLAPSALVAVVIVRFDLINYLLELCKA